MEQQRVVETIPRQSSLPEILLGKYQLGRLLGRGSFAKVYYAKSIKTDAPPVAIKIIDKTSIVNTNMEPRIIREVSAMRRLEHPNIIRINEVMATRSKIYLVMEYARGGDVFSKIVRRGKLTELVARRYFQQLVSAIHFCHVNGVAHRDIKPQNLLLDHEGNLKVSDFGLSALEESMQDGLLQTACGTPAYTAPEVIGRKGYAGPKADAWSCGVILFVFLAGSIPFNDSNLLVMYSKIHRREFEFPSWISRPVKRIISRLLDPNPKTRMSIEELMEVPWLKSSSSQCKLDDKSDLTLPIPKTNAFDIISMSSGLDLSPLFEGGKKREKRFTSTTPREKIFERVDEIGGKLGYVVESRKGGVKGLVKGRFVLLIEVLEVAAALFLVDVKVLGEGVAELEEVWWGELKAGLEDIVFSWHKDTV
ncbi:hypothetical protein GIB67_025581 [Kingdonia uniflora]|uniref:non-specific serine/threonine protein kinase n=1 Tax=Kingdonia uniflora TaxID=39325 RepID=A0A7J7M0J5_9MAGN|nr:hypothetical protein GIB67_025581 [Kingdonia uniflora]